MTQPSKRASSGFHLTVGPANVFIYYDLAEPAYDVYAEFEAGHIDWQTAVLLLQAKSLENQGDSLFGDTK